MANKWTPAEDRKLAKMRDEGKTFKQIAEALNRTEPACQQRHWKNKNVVSETLTNQDVAPTKPWWKRVLGL